MINDYIRLNDVLDNAIEEQARAYEIADANGDSHIFEYKMITICVNGFSFDFEYGDDLISALRSDIDKRIDKEIDEALEDPDLNDIVGNMPCDTYGMAACGPDCPVYFSCDAK